MPETLIHYSNKPLLEIKSTPLDHQRNDFKPRGLWVSVQGPDDWKAWCLAETFELSALSISHRIILAKGADIFRLRDAAGIDTFTEKYAVQDPTRSYSIDWKRLAQQYDGIIIAPYIWERRFSNGVVGVGWYYSWDCASGCIWNASAVKEIVRDTV